MADGISTVAVIGLGRLGLSIAFELAMCARRNALNRGGGGNVFRVMAYDASDKSGAEFRETIRRELCTSLVEETSRRRADGLDTRQLRRTMRENEELAIESHILFNFDLSTAVRHADLVVEAVYEDLQVKRDLFRRIESLCEKKNVILCTNTLSLRLGDISGEGSLSRPLVGFRFLHPVLYIPLVELTVNDQNREATRVVADFATNHLKKIAMGFDLSTLLAGEAEAAALVDARASTLLPLGVGTTFETLRARQERMHAVGYLRYRMDDGVAWRYRDREARERWALRAEDPSSSSSTSKMCVVCLNEEEAGHPMVVLPNCGHACFCTVCIASVLRANARSVCPLCRTAFSADEVHVVF